MSIHNVICHDSVVEAMTKSRMTVFALVCLSIIVILVSVKLRPCSVSESFTKDDASVIFTCTTFLSKPGKLEQFIAAMDSLMFEDKMLIGTFVVINEYDASSTEDFGTILVRKYPFIQFYQKRAEEAGQARSLNMILKIIKPYTFWIHWEESWVCVRPFVKKALSIMEDDEHISQIQLTQDWLESEYEMKNGYRIIYVHPEYSDVVTYKEVVASGYALWPLYSLRPSVNRVYHYRDLGMFDENPAKWPVEFEFDYSKKWVKRGNVKAIIRPECAVRHQGHVSTYASV